jgi:hypothetical protein
MLRWAYGRWRFVIVGSGFGVSLAWDWKEMVMGVGEGL